MPLDYAVISRGIQETVAIGNGEAAPDLSSLGTTARLAAETLLRAMDDFIDGEMQPDLIRADCELLAAWEHSNDNPDQEEAILTFVLARRGATEWPAWAESWVEGEDSDA